MFEKLNFDFLTQIYMYTSFTILLQEILGLYVYTLKISFRYIAWIFSFKIQAKSTPVTWDPVS